MTMLCYLEIRWIAHWTLTHFLNFLGWHPRVAMRNVGGGRFLSGDSGFWRGRWRRFAPPGIHRGRMETGWLVPLTSNDTRARLVIILSQRAFFFQWFCHHLLPAHSFLYCCHSSLSLCLSLSHLAVLGCWWWKPNRTRSRMDRGKKSKKSPFPSKGRQGLP